MEENATGNVRACAQCAHTHTRVYAHVTVLGSKAGPQLQPIKILLHPEEQEVRICYLLLVKFVEFLQVFFLIFSFYGCMLCMHFREA